MIDPKNVNPYDARSVRRYSNSRKIDREKRLYIEREIARLKFECGSETINPYDLGQVARMHNIFRTSRELYRWR